MVYEKIFYYIMVASSELLQFVDVQGLSRGQQWTGHSC